MSRLALRHQLRTGDSHLTPEDSQVIENKRNRMQKLIEMFEHQADGFLLHHQAIDDLPISTLGDYEEYDHVDEMDDSGVPIPAVQLSNASGNQGSSAEDIPLLLPSTLGLDWCVSHGVKSLAINEAKLRYGQANDSMHRIRLALGFKSALFRTHVRVSHTQQTKTRAWTAVHGVDTSVHQHARNYSMARDAYLKVKDASGDSPELPLLRSEDLRVHTAVLGGAQVGQRNKQLSWIWSFGTSVKQDGTWTDECK
jgi:hypothetical protein